MQDNFGKKLEEARTRQGISIREAAEATKIRSDFLLSFENDHGNFDLPKVYRHGFIRNYARFLKLDPDELLQDYILFHEGKARGTKREVRESYGKLELTPRETKNSPEQTTLPFKAAENPHQEFNSSKNSEPKKEEKSSPKKISTFFDTKSLYMKIGLAFGGGVFLITCVVLLISTLLKKPVVAMPQDTEIAEVFDSNEFQDDVFKPTDAFVPTDILEQLILTSTNDVRVVVRQERDKKALYTGNVDEKNPIIITRRGPVKIHFSNGSDLVIQKPDGQKVRPGREGVGWIEI